MGLSFSQYLTYGGSKLVDIDATAEAGVAIPGCRAVRFKALDGNSGTLFYKGGANAADLDPAATGDDADGGVPLAAGGESGWLPGGPDAYYFAGSAANQGLVIEWMV